MNDKPKTYKIITVQRFVDCLKAIGWDINWRGCDSYYLVNAEGADTKFYFDIGNKDWSDEYMPDLSLADSCFGSFQGDMRISVKTSVLELFDDWLTIRIADGTALSFYNFAKKKKKPTSKLTKKEGKFNDKYKED